MATQPWECSSSANGVARACGSTLPPVLRSLPRLSFPTRLLPRRVRPRCILPRRESSHRDRAPCGHPPDVRLAVPALLPRGRSGAWSLPVLAVHIWLKKYIKPPLCGRIAVQPSLLNFLSPKKMSTIYTLPRLWTFFSNEKG